MYGLVFVAYHHLLHSEVDTIKGGLNRNLNPFESRRYSSLLIFRNFLHCKTSAFFISCFLVDMELVIQTQYGYSTPPLGKTFS